MAVILGGGNAYRQHVVGDVVVSLQWVEGEPALVLFPRQRRTLNPGAYIICLSSAWQYDDVSYLVRQAAIAARVMGMDESRQTIHRIGTAIHDHLLDLITMPPEPQWHKDAGKGPAVAEIEVRANGRTIREHAIDATGATVN